jgi:hypothetical protein
MQHDKQLTQVRPGRSPTPPPPLQGESALPGLGGILRDPRIINSAAQLLLQLPFSRRAEAEADLIGLKLMALAGAGGGWRGAGSGGGVVVRGWKMLWGLYAVVWQGWALSWGTGTWWRVLVGPWHCRRQSGLMDAACSCSNKVHGVWRVSQGPPYTHVVTEGCGTSVAYCCKGSAFYCHTVRGW